MMSGSENPRYELDRHTLEMLVCPLTKTRLSLDTDKNELISHAARMAFPIVKGVPLLSFEEARTLSEEEMQSLSQKAR